MRDHDWDRFNDQFRETESERNERLRAKRRERSHPCDKCRFWSEMIAQSIGGGPIEAMCLSDDSPHKGQYTRERQTCEAWKSDHYGKIDDPPDYGERVRAAYAAEENPEGPDPMRGVEFPFAENH